MLRLKFQNFGHLISRTNSLEKTLMLGKIEGKRRRGHGGWHGYTASQIQWTWIWANSWRQWSTGAWRAALQGVTENWAGLRDGTTTELSTVTGPIYIPTNSAGVSLFSHPLPRSFFIDFFKDDHFDFCEVVPHWGLLCISLISSHVEHLFMCLLLICMSCDWLLIKRLVNPGGTLTSAFPKRCHLSRVKSFIGIAEVLNIKYWTIQRAWICKALMVWSKMA